MPAAGSIAAIVPAAGQSKRFGGVKLTRPLPDGNTLVGRTVETALAAGCELVVVVTGAHAPQIRLALAQLPVVFAHNAQWAQGMGSSIGCAARFLLSNPNQPDAVFLLLADQPYLHASLLRKMKQLYDDHSPKAIWCNYGQAFGPPVLFDGSLLEQLALLEGHEGAKSILKKLHDEVLVVSFPEGQYDIDSPDDWENFVQ